MYEAQIGIVQSIESDVDFGCTGGKPEVRRGRLKVEVHDFIDVSVSYLPTPM